MTICRGCSDEPADLKVDGTPLGEECLALLSESRHELLARDGVHRLREV